jgi:hypothetical protein
VSHLVTSDEGTLQIRREAAETWRRRETVDRNGWPDRNFSLLRFEVWD